MTDSGQPVRGDVGRLPEHAVVVGVVVDEHPEDRPEVLGGEHLVGGVVGLHHGRPDEVALAVVGGAAGQDLHAVLAADPVQDAGEPVEGPLVDHRAEEVGEVGDVAHRQCRSTSSMKPSRSRDHTERGM